ncbi:Hematopoietic prostaglandin D synthase [Trichoplax sp. H2]|nr:Hematopoietic prostaglandin D synthase [Trichoplax sp. H2]|eukprot:RDD47698.1 Hematopoietic prostaglandin D synthase [Trichoplax sp. H2]
MPSIKLTYFNGPGRAELIRLIFAQGGVDFTDERIEGKDWPELKSSGRFPFQQIPILEVDGHVYVQSTAIARAAARFSGLAGKTSLEQALADEIVDFLQADLQEKIIKFLFGEKDEDKKAELKKKFVEEEAPKGLGFLQKRLEQAGGEYFTGSLTYADIGFYRFVKFTENILNGEEMATQFPKLAALYDRVANLPNIKKYAEEHKS